MLKVISDLCLVCHQFKYLQTIATYQIAIYQNNNNHNNCLSLTFNDSNEDQMLKKFVVKFYSLSKPCYFFVVFERALYDVTRVFSFFIHGRILRVYYVICETFSEKFDRL